MNTDEIQEAINKGFKKAAAPTLAEVTKKDLITALDLIKAQSGGTFDYAGQTAPTGNFVITLTTLPQQPEITIHANYVVFDGIGEDSVATTIEQVAERAKNAQNGRTFLAAKQPLFAEPKLNK